MDIDDGGPKCPQCFCRRVQISGRLGRSRRGQGSTSNVQERSPGHPSGIAFVESPVLGSMQQRLQKLISAAGIASRRHAEELITAGRVTVNGKIVTELGAKADPKTDHIKVKGLLINALLTQH